MIRPLTFHLDEPAATHLSVLGLWSCTARAPGSISHPDQLDDRDWFAATAPGTVASALNAEGRWNWEQPTDLDASDWWFRTRFSAAPTSNQPAILAFDGLATLAEIWLNGKQILTTDNMFRAYILDVAPWLESENDLVLGFRSLSEELKKKSPRPKWKTNLVSHQQLRRVRTSLLGRIPGWSPCAPTIGPWREVRFESAPMVLRDLQFHTKLEATTGVVTIRAEVSSTSEPTTARLQVGDASVSLTLAETDDGWMFAGELRLENAPLWWPHTHGEPRLLDCELTIETSTEHRTFPCKPIGFRKLEVVSADQFGLIINDQPIYCRGACWTVADLLAPTVTETTLRRDLTLARDAGVNMLRIGGTMTYESDLFYRLCDELGILVWQDFMFANMDYPVDDPAFNENIATEAVQQLKRLARHPSIAVYCGNSEIEQQSAMLGMPREAWSNAWFSKQLPAWCRQYHPGTAYLPSTPTGGVLPFHTNVGVTHYYGVGAYLRSPLDLRKADVRFTSECLGFANIPEPKTMQLVTGSPNPAMHDPRWKRRVPRDSGAGWDFEDVRDHYLRELYNIDPAALRSCNMPRYVRLSRVVSGEMMTLAFSEWRSTHSRNRGGLIWFYKDLWPGAGWGIVDSTGMPKAPYYYLKRVWNTRQITIADEGLNGLDLHLTNETSRPCEGTVEITLLKEPHTVIARKEATVQIDASSQLRLSVDEILGRFYDSTYAYRFGPPQHDLVMATWKNSDGQIISQAIHFVRRNVNAMASTTAVQASAQPTSNGAYQVTLKADRFLHAIRFDADGYLPDDNYFHLPPQQTKVITFRSTGEQTRTFRPVLEALNLESDLSIPLTGAPA